MATSRLAVRANDADLTSGSLDHDIEIMKIHGCVKRSRPKEFVLTQQDYEEFEQHRPVMSQRLRHDLIHNSILFLGYSYRDPNITTALVAARCLSQGDTQAHFLITKKETDPSNITRQDLWLSDLRRSGIRAATIKEYEDLTGVLNSLALASRGSSIFITGSRSATPPLADELRAAPGS